MDYFLIVILVLWLTIAAGNTKKSILPLGPTTNEDIKPNEQKAELCQLPPYPKRGGYVVINETSAAPGDVFDGVSLVRFTTDRDKKVFEIKRFTCSFGQWYQDIIEYESDALHFYTSWCPYFCSSFLSDQWTECTTPNSDENLRGARQCGSNLPKHQLEQNDIDLEEFCHLPPYPNKGTYVVQGRPEARPGDLLQNVSLIQYTGDARDEVITIKHLRCSSGAWYQKVFREAAESQHFHTSWCPNLCSECFGQKIAERPHYPLINNKVSKKKDNSQTTAFSCVLPQPPKFGNYSVIGKLEATQPGEYGFLNLNYKCNTGYTLIGNRNVCCMKGAWSVALPKCTKFCHLIRQTGVVYACEEAGAGTGVESCGVYLPEGSVVTPRCNTPYYESRSPLKPMTCEDGKWSNLPECKAVCGLRMQGEESPAADARVKAPWNVAVYSKFPEFYLFHCGGSIVARNLVISTAACFMNFKSELLPTVNFLVMAGKLFYDKNKGNDDKAQESEVQNIIVSPRYTGSTNSHQHDIALVFLATPFTYDVQHVWPVCLNFDKDLDKTQLSEGRSGIVAGWGTSVFGFNDVLQIKELPNVDVQRCVAKALDEKTIFVYKTYHITSDKICAGNDTGNQLCMQEKGAGFAVPETDPLDARKSYYYLRGAVSLYDILRGSSTHEDINPNARAAELCRLPPYPRNGGYVVLNETSATLEDAFQRISLVECRIDRNKEGFEIKRFTCSFGQWHQDIIEHESDALHFYTSWCPYFCSSFTSEQ